MLEIKNLTKVYTAKGGMETRALDDVSVSFGETGLVFLLGKSGSGKSTLLNLAGGLDAPTSGEIVVMGKSSKDFSGADFDSYRNTFVGFIFQEYNILDEFTVEDNIALALELQGKPKDREKILSILNDVELASYADRKPNTLSGGQKQRIAIARALVKDPQIIMADEPTGALDSATGKQVFDTLKKLSSTRLVLVVSHDREFAEVYGDRIIELKDGKIVSDVTKEHIAAEQVTGSVLRLGEDTLTMRGGTPDRETLDEIVGFLKESEGEVLLSKGKEDIAAFRRINRIGEDGARERFVATQETKGREYDGAETKFIRSRLPVLKAIKIGASGLKLKPFRLILTILLSVAAFIMFGLASTMMLYSERTVLVNSFLSSDCEYVTVLKRYETRHYFDGEYAYTADRTAKFTPAEVKSFGDGAIGAYSVNFAFGNLKGNSYYYLPQVNALGVPAEGALSQKLLAGRLPSADDEILVSSYFLSCAEALDYYPVLSADGTVLADTPVKIHSAEELLGTSLLTGEKVLKVCGVFDSGSLPKKYDGLKNLTEEDEFDMQTDMDLFSFRSYLREGLHTLAFTTETLAEFFSTYNYSVHYGYFDGARQTYAALNRDEYGEYESVGTWAFAVYDPAGERPLLPVILAEERTALDDDEFIVPLSALLTLYRDALPDQDADGYADYKAFLDKMERADAMPEEEIISSVRNFLAAHPIEREFFAHNYDKDGLSYESVGTFRIVGAYLSGDSTGNLGFYCSENTYHTLVAAGSETEETNYVAEPDAKFGGALVPLERSSAALNRLFDRLEVTDPATDVFFTLGNTLYDEVGMASDIVEELSLVFLVIGIVLAVFASLLLFNFISMSITNKKKEIGILRAVGARGTDVFKIFFAESGIIVGVCTLLALIGTGILTFVINNILKSNIGFDVTLFVFGAVPVLVMVFVALFVSLISTFLPVYLAARKKPVESIRSL